MGMITIKSKEFRDEKEIEIIYKRKKITEFEHEGVSIVIVEGSNCNVMYFRCFGDRENLNYICRIDKDEKDFLGRYIEKINTPLMF